MLGVPSSATEKELSRAYKKLAKQHHPDANAGQRQAPRSASRRSTPRTTCSATPTKRKEYDEVRRMVASGVGPGGFGGGGRVRRRRRAVRRSTSSAGGARASPTCSATCSAGRSPGGRGGRARSGPQRGQDLETELHLVVRRRRARRHEHRAVPRRRDVLDVSRVRARRRARMPETCPECHGSGSIAVDQGPFSFSQVCPTCGGRGQVIPTPCPTCHGPRRRDARPRGEGARPGRRRRRAAHPREGPRRRGRERRAARRPLRGRARRSRTRCSGAAATTSRCGCRSRSRKRRSAPT